MYEEIYKYGLGFQNSQILNLMNHEFINVFNHNRTILELTFNKAKQQPSICDLFLKILQSHDSESCG